MKAAVWKKRGKKIVALNRSIRKNLIKVKEFTRQHNCGREGGGKYINLAHFGLKYFLQEYYKFSFVSVFMISVLHFFVKIL